MKKPNRDLRVRPTAVGCTYRRLIAKVVVKHYIRRPSRLCWPIQVWCGYFTVLRSSCACNPPFHLATRPVKSFNKAWHFKRFQQYQPRCRLELCPNSHARIATFCVGLLGLRSDAVLSLSLPCLLSPSHACTDIVQCLLPSHTEFISKWEVSDARVSWSSTFPNHPEHKNHQSAWHDIAIQWITCSARTTISSLPDCKLPLQSTLLPGLKPFRSPLLVTYLAPMNFVLL